MAVCEGFLGGHVEQICCCPFQGRVEPISTLQKADLPPKIASRRLAPAVEVHPGKLHRITPLLSACSRSEK